MRIIDVIHQLLPNVAGSLPRNFAQAQPATAGRQPPVTCPIWPPDIFAVVATIVDRSGSYTEFSPDRDELILHEQYLDRIDAIVKSWVLLSVPDAVTLQWDALVNNFGNVDLSEVKDKPDLLNILLVLLASADEVSQGLGWERDRLNPDTHWSDFAQAVFLNSLEDDDGARANLSVVLPHWPRSLCSIIAPDRVVVLPKSITADKGCTIRSLSHNLSLLPCHTRLDAEWRLVTREVNERLNDDVRLLLVPFPFDIPDGSFSLAAKRTRLKNDTTHAAFFRLHQQWLNSETGERLTGADLAKNLILPLLVEATAAAGGLVPHGVVLPECALDEDTVVELAPLLADAGVEFLIAGVLEFNQVKERWLNKAYTLFLQSGVGRPQSKQHRWRIDKKQADSYGIRFDGDDPNNEQWWEDIDVSERLLPFYAFRKDTSLVTLICEDLARMEPAMTAIRAVGPNLVVALLMDGPQLGGRWPGRYAAVLADEPGCAVLSLTCAATVDLSNKNHKASKPDADTKRAVARWTQSRDLLSKDLELDDGAVGILLTLESYQKHQTTLDNRSDHKNSRELVYKSHISIGVGQPQVSGA